MTAEQKKQLESKIIAVVEKELEKDNTNNHCNYEKIATLVSVLSSLSMNCNASDSLSSKESFANHFKEYIEDNNILLLGRD